MSYLPIDLTAQTLVSLQQIYQDLQALDTAISGNLTQSAMSSATRFPSGASGGPTMLANDDVEVWFTLRWGGPTGTALAVSATQPIDCAPVPGTAIYTVQSASYTYFSLGAAGTAGSISVNIGTLAAGVFTSTTTIVNAVALANVAGASQTVTGTLAIATATFTASASAQLAALCTVASVTTTPRLVIVLRCTRSLI